MKLWIVQRITTMYGYESPFNNLHTHTEREREREREDIPYSQEMKTASFRSRDSPLFIVKAVGGPMLHLRRKQRCSNGWWQTDSITACQCYEIATAAAAAAAIFLSPWSDFLLSSCSVWLQLQLKLTLDGGSWIGSGFGRAILDPLHLTFLYQTIPLHPSNKQDLSRVLSTDTDLLTDLPDQISGGGIRTPSVNYRYRYRTTDTPIWQDVLFRRQARVQSYTSPVFDDFNCMYTNGRTRAAVCHASIALRLSIATRKGPHIKQCAC